MRNQKQEPQALPPLTRYRLRRLRQCLPLNVLAVRAGIPASSLSRFERDEKDLTADQLARLEAVLSSAEGRGHSDAVVTPTTELADALIDALADAMEVEG